jgi:transketolase
MPQLRVVRPADANETAVAWQVAIESNGPTALILSRQDLPVVVEPEAAQGLRKGAYVVAETDGADGDPDIVLIGTGSEVSVCLEAKPLLEQEGVTVRVVSMPCWELFSLLGEGDQEDVLTEGAPRLAVEAATSFGWERWADDAVAIDHFGASAPGAVALANFGYTAGNVAARAKQLLIDLAD